MRKENFGELVDSKIVRADWITSSAVWRPVTSCSANSDAIVSKEFIRLIIPETSLSSTGTSRTSRSSSVESAEMPEQHQMRESRATSQAVRVERRASWISSGKLRCSFKGGWVGIVVRLPTRSGKHSDVTGNRRLGLGFDYRADFEHFLNGRTHFRAVLEADFLNAGDEFAVEFVELGLSESHIAVPPYADSNT